MISSPFEYSLYFYHPENTFCINAPHVEIVEIHEDCEYILDSITVNNSADGEKIQNHCQGKILLCDQYIGEGL